MRSADRPDVLDRVERWARDSLSIASIPHARRVLALVRIARAARAYRSAEGSTPDLQRKVRVVRASAALDAALEELEADK